MIVQWCIYKPMIVHVHASTRGVFENIVVPHVAMTLCDIASSHRILWHCQRWLSCKNLKHLEVEWLRFAVFSTFYRTLYMMFVNRNCSFPWLAFMFQVLLLATPSLQEIFQKPLGNRPHCPIVFSTLRPLRRLQNPIGFQLFPSFRRVFLLLRHRHRGHPSLVLVAKVYKAMKRLPRLKGFLVLPLNNHWICVLFSPIPGFFTWRKIFPGIHNSRHAIESCHWRRWLRCRKLATFMSCLDQIDPPWSPSSFSHLSKPWWFERKHLRMILSFGRKPHRYRRWGRFFPFFPTSLACRPSKKWFHAKVEFFSWWFLPGCCGPWCGWGNPGYSNHNGFGSHNLDLPRTQDASHHQDCCIFWYGITTQNLHLAGILGGGDPSHNVWGSGTFHG